MVTSLKHPGKNQSGSSSRLPLTWTNRATPRADAQCYKHRPVDRQMDRMTAIQRLKAQRQTDTHTPCSDLQGPARPEDHCVVLALEELTRGRILGPTNLCLGSLQTTSPRHPATPSPHHPAIPPPKRSVRAQGRPPPGAQDTGSPDAAAADAKARAPSLRTRETPTPWVQVGQDRHPPSSSHPAASAGAGASIPRGSPGRHRPRCRSHRRACAEPPRGAGPGPALTVAHAGLRLAGWQARHLEAEERFSESPGLRLPEGRASHRAENRQTATPTADWQSSSTPVDTSKCSSMWALALAS